MPVFGAIVYVPNAALEPIKTGASCEKCGSVPSGSPVATTVTDTSGKFVLSNAPSGTNITLVIQVGKWRRQITIPTVTACAETAVTDKNLTCLPRNKTEGILPKIAVIAGGSDRLQCLFFRMGIDVSEFTNPTGTGAVNIYNMPADLGADLCGGYDSTVNSGAKYPDARAFWEDLNAMLKYDMIFLACGGVQSATDPRKYAPYNSGGDPSPISDNAKANMVKYLAAGARAFGGHYNWAWIKGFPATGTIDHSFP